MIAKAKKTTLIIALFSLVGLTVPAGVSQTVFAQSSIAKDAVGGTLLEGFFDDESNEEDEADSTESQAADQEQDQAQDQEQDQEQDQAISQDETATQGNNAEAGDNTGTIGQNVEGNTVEGADCGDALICFGNDIVNDAEQDQDASLHDVPQENTATFGNDEADNTGVQHQDQDQDEDADQRAANVALKLALGL
jgi:hypothetical protein